MAQTYINNSREFLRLFKENRLSAHEEMAAVGLEGINEETPVDTGQLKSKNVGVGKKDFAEWSNDESYAPYVHLGTYKQSANPFMIRGVMKKTSQIIRAVISRLRV